MGNNVQTYPRDLYVVLNDLILPYSRAELPPLLPCNAATYAESMEQRKQFEWPAKWLAFE